MDMKQIRALLEKNGQREMLQMLEHLAEKERDLLFPQLQKLDWKRLECLRAILHNPPPRKSFADIQPAPVKQLPRSNEDREADRRAAEAGRDLLRNDRAAALTVAGGQGTRLGYDGPKGAYPITPINRKSLFQYLGEKILAARSFYGCRMPWLIMTSPANDGATKDFFEENSFFALGRDTVHFFSQNVNPILGPDGNLVLDENGGLLLGPDGHGGVFEALKSSGLTDKLMREDFDLISYFQVDNPLVSPADERFLGHHIMQKADFSCKVAAKRDPFEGLGAAVLDNGRPAIVEYIDLPEERAVEKNDSGELKYRFGSIAIHIVNTAFADRMASTSNALPWHVAEKKYRVRRPEGLKETRCYKFEKFVFDCLAHADGCAFVEVERRSEFAPVKNAEGKDSPRECVHMLQAQWKQILNRLGIDLSSPSGEDVTVEISPLISCNASELKP